jgi:hypothetical protein
VAPVTVEVARKSKKFNLIYVIFTVRPVLFICLYGQHFTSVENVNLVPSNLLLRLGQ